MECTQCKKPASLFCSGCRQSPKMDGDKAPVRYCGADCQKSDWQKHKKDCRRLKDRLLLYRVCSLAQQFFYLYREVTYNSEGYMIKRVERKPVDPIHLLVWPESHTAESVLDLYGIDLRQAGVNIVEADSLPGTADFPAYLFASKHEREAALSLNGCRQASKILVEFFGLFPKGFIQSADNIHHDTKGEKLVSQFRALPPGVDKVAELPGWRHFHSAVKVILQSGEAYIIDLSAAQLGHQEPVIPWNLYQNTYLLELKKDIEGSSALPPKGILQLADCSLSVLNDATRRQATDLAKADSTYIKEYVLVYANIWILSWQANSKTSIKSMLALIDETFLAKQASLIDFLHWSFCTAGSELPLAKSARGKQLCAQVPSIDSIEDQARLASIMRF